MIKDNFSGIYNKFKLLLYSKISTIAKMSRCRISKSSAWR